MRPVCREVPELDMMCAYPCMCVYRYEYQHDPLGLQDQRRKEEREADHKARVTDKPFKPAAPPKRGKLTRAWVFSTSEAWVEALNTQLALYRQVDRDRRGRLAQHRRKCVNEQEHKQ